MARELAGALGCSLQEPGGQQGGRISGPGEKDAAWVAQAGGDQTDGTKEESGGIVPRLGCFGSVQVTFGTPKVVHQGHLELRRRSRSGLVVVFGESPALSVIADPGTWTELWVLQIRAPCFMEGGG